MHTLNAAGSNASVNLWNGEGPTPAGDPSPERVLLDRFSGDSGALLLEPPQPPCSRGRFTVQAKRSFPESSADSSRVPSRRGERVPRRKRGLRVAISPARITLAEWTLLKKGVGKGIRWVAVDGVVDQLRGVKDASEIGQIREAARLGSEVPWRSIGLIRPGLTKWSLRRDRLSMRRKVASGESFETIVAAGPRSALPPRASHPTPNRHKRIGRRGPGCYTSPLLQ